MSDFIPSAELEAMQDQLRAMHKKLHDYAKQFPSSNVDIISVAVSLTDASRKLDKLAEDARFVEKRKR